MAVEFSLPIFGVIIPASIIAFCGYGFYFAILVRHHETTGQLIWFQFSLCMVWLSYYLAIKTPAGSPSKDFKPREKEWRRWCIKCNAYKPERTHHCRQCKTCVLRMDHHCPWTYNCVGHNNMPHFIRFLIWVQITCCYALYHLFGQASRLYQDRKLPAYLVPRSEIVFTIILIPLVLFVQLTIFLLSIRLFTHIFEGKTQIEEWEIQRVKNMARRKMFRYVDFPYDIDPWTNLCQAWGSPLTWWFPWGGPEGDGMHFEKNEVVDDGSIWPPDHQDQDRPKEANLPYLRTMATSMAQRVHVESDLYRRHHWKNIEGEGLSDFGVDPETEPDQEDIPLSVIQDGQKKTT